MLLFQRLLIPNAIEKSYPYFGGNFKAAALVKAGYSPAINYTEYNEVINRLLKEETFKRKYDQYLNMFKSK